MPQTHLCLRQKAAGLPLTRVPGGFLASCLWLMSVVALIKQQCDAGRVDAEGRGLVGIGAGIVVVVAEHVEICPAVV